MERSTTTWRTKNEVIAIDSRNLKITARWPVAPAGQPVAIALDRQSRRLFVAGRNPKTLVMMDAGSGRIIGQPLSIGGRVDTNTFDTGTALAACSTGDGTINIFHEDSPGKLSGVERVATEFGAKTMALDPQTHNLLVDTADFSTPESRPKPGTFRLLVYGR